MCRCQTVKSNNNGTITTVSAETLSPQTVGWWGQKDSQVEHEQAAPGLWVFMSLGVGVCVCVWRNRTHEWQWGSSLQAASVSVWFSERSARWSTESPDEREEWNDWRFTKKGRPTGLCVQVCVYLCALKAALVCSLSWPPNPTSPRVQTWTYCMKSCPYVTERGRKKQV